MKQTSWKLYHSCFYGEKHFSLSVFQKYYEIVVIKDIL